MIETKRLKIWILVTHALIIIGMGHGILSFAILEIFWFAGLVKSVLGFTFFSSLFTSQIFIFVVLCLAGQSTLIFSLVSKNNKRKRIFYIVALVLLWLSLICFSSIANKDSYTYLATITALPFAICTIKALLGKPLQKFFYWIIDKDVEN